jgi:hypothetical protein
MQKRDFVGGISVGENAGGRLFVATDHVQNAFIVEIADPLHNALGVIKKRGHDRPAPIAG